MKVAVLALLIFFIVGCTNTNKIPEDILPKAKMEVVLWDVIQAERFSVLYLLKDSSQKNVQLEKFRLYDQVFSVHKISKDDFIKSYKYYLSRPDIAKIMFDSIAVKAERERNESIKPAPLK